MSCEDCCENLIEEPSIFDRNSLQKDSLSAEQMEQRIEQLRNRTEQTINQLKQSVRQELQTFDKRMQQKIANLDRRVYVFGQSWKDRVC